MKTVRVTRRARLRLADIFEYSIFHWGPIRAEAYRLQFLDRVRALASGRLPAGRSCAILAPEGHNFADLKYLQVGVHYIIYREMATAIEIIEFVHQSRNLESIVDHLSSNTED